LGSKEEYAQSLEKLDNLPYLSKKAMKSNINSPQCIYHKYQNAKVTKLDPSEPTLPFKIILKPYDSKEYEKEEGNKEAIRINLSLVILHITLRFNLL